MSSPFDDSIVTDTGPLISLERLDGGYEFMRRMYRRMIAPPAVLREIAVGQLAAPSSYLEHYSIADFVFEQAPRFSPQNIPWQNDLHLGELDRLGILTDQRGHQMLEQLLHNGRIGQALFALLVDSLLKEKES